MNSLPLAEGVHILLMQARILWDVVVSLQDLFHFHLRTETDSRDVHICFLQKKKTKKQTKTKTKTKTDQSSIYLLRYSYTSLVRTI